MFQYSIFYLYLEAENIPSCISKYQDMLYDKKQPEFVILKAYSLRIGKPLVGNTNSNIMLRFCFVPPLVSRNIGVHPFLLWKKWEQRACLKFYGKIRSRKPE